MKNNNYFTVMGWMVNELNLSGNTLNVYALIYGFSQDGDSHFSGSLNYISDSLGIGRTTIIRILNDLESKGLIVREQTIKDNSFDSNIYKAVFRGSTKMALGSTKIDEGSTKMALGGSAKMIPNINIYNNNTIEIGALDFLNANHTIEFEQFCITYKKQINEWEKFVADFNDTVIQEGLGYDEKLFGRLRKYARNYINNQKRFNQNNNNQPTASDKIKLT